MTPLHKAKLIVLALYCTWKDKPEPSGLTAEQVDAMYAQACEECDIQDLRNEVREGEYHTGLSRDNKGVHYMTERHYDSHEVAAMTVDGEWVGWTCWTGGGKFGQPDSLEWMEHAYSLSVTEKPVTTIERTFTPVPANGN